MMQLLRGEVYLFRELVVYVRDSFLTYKQRSYECRCCEVIVVSICSGSHNFYVFGMHWTTDLSNKIFDCLLKAVTKVPSVDRNNA